MNVGRENEITEFKVSTSELEDALIDIVAILNKRSQGRVLFGVKNDGEVCGFQIGPNTERDISRRIYESIKPQIYPAIVLREEDGKRYIEVLFSGEDKPYSADGRYYLRTSDERGEMTPGELARFLLKQNYSLWERLPSDCSLNDVDEDSLERFLDKAIQSQRLPEMPYEKTRLLSKLNLLTMDGAHLNNAGKLLFSKKKTIKLKMGVFATNEKRTFLDISPIEGNIFTLIEEAQKYIKKNIRYSVVIDGFDRIDVPEIPEQALREIVVNSFAHANYLSNSQHEIDIFPNRIAICNPGPFPDEYSPEDFVERDLSSKIVNGLVCDVLFKCKAIESWGTGLKNTYEICQKAKVPVSYQREQEGFWFIFHRRDLISRHDIKNKSIAKQSFRRNGEEAPLSETELLVLEEIQRNPNARRGDLAQATGRSLRTVQRTIDSLKEKGILQRLGPKNGGKWLIADLSASVADHN